MPSIDYWASQFSLKPLQRVQKYYSLMVRLEWDTSSIVAEVNWGGFVSIQKKKKKERKKDPSSASLYFSEITPILSCDVHKSHL